MGPHLNTVLTTLNATAWFCYLAIPMHLQGSLMILNLCLV